MGFILLWAGAMATGIFFSAMMIAWASGVTGKWKGRFIRLVGALLPVLIPGSCAFVVHYSLDSVLSAPTGWFFYFVSWVVVFMVGVIWLEMRNRQRIRAASPAWSAWRLGLFCSGFLLLSAMTFWNLDNISRDHLQTVRVEANVSLMSGIPARVPIHLNAAQDYSRVFEALAMFESKFKDHIGLIYKFDVLSGKEVLIGKDWTDPKLIEAMKAIAPILRGVRKAAAKPYCFYERDYGQGMGMLLPELGSFRSSARWLRVEAKMAASRGNFELALNNIRAQTQLARHVGTEPLLVSMFVSVTIESIAVKTLSESLQYGLPSSAALKALDDSSSSGFQMSYQRALKMESAFAMLTFSQVSSVEKGSDLLLMLGDSAWTLPEKVGLSFWRVFLLSDELSAYREIMGRYVGRSRQPYYTSKINWERKTDDRRPAGMLASMLLPRSRRFARSVAYADAAHRLIALSRGVLRYRLREGHAPQNEQVLLAAGDIDLPTIDPFTGKPLGLIVMEDSVIIYSVGADSKYGVKSVGQFRPDDVVVIISMKKK